MAPCHSFGVGAAGPSGDRFMASSSLSESVATGAQGAKIQLAQRQGQPNRLRRDTLDEQGSDCGASEASTTASTVDAISVDDVAFFKKYTYSNECALLAQNFHNQCKRLGVFDRLPYQHDTRLISVTLVYVFYKFQCHHCDMALDLALTLCYLEDLMEEPSINLGSQVDALTVTVTLVFLAHSHNADRAIRLKDWFREVLWRAFPDVKGANAFVFLVFKNLLRFRTTRRDNKVKRHVQRLCSVAPCSNSTSVSTDSVNVGVSIDKKTSVDDKEMKTVQKTPSGVQHITSL
eukprot:gnl/MRDRNA2_/MRDRNA2_31281_c0_seq1.p1 gnl/MRDRNA2_/MRDRNA2_31281_c0~~gnl/MRDRNA2_/MRDRNA2_31281_c0_seq1.p1  ORF type:complete len:290 (+),score=39.81 gnl/MRDRNA2_/MRDRNA2_31281_c0_seq1:87-956(+)